MFSSASSTYNLKRPARCIAALASSEESAEEEEQHGSMASGSRFVVGTCSLREPNELHVLGFHEESNELLCHQALSHPDEIWGVSPSPSDPSLLATCSNGAKAEPNRGGAGFKVNLWRLPAPDPNDEPLHEHAMGGDRGHPLAPLGEPLAEIGGLKAAASAMLWNPSGGMSSTQGEGGGFVTLADGQLKQWHVGDGRFEEAGCALVYDGSAGAAAVAARGAPAAAWDPHRPVEVATAASCSVVCWDLRTMKPTTSVAEAHRFAVRDVDYNPNKPFCLATCGEDRLIKFWDLRRPNAPVKTILGHDHWVNTVKYNRFHDQLLVSGSSDCLVHLWRVSSVSSAPLLEPEDDDDDAGGLDGDGGAGDAGGYGGGGSWSKGEAADIRVRTFDEHEESVYSLAWSASDAWVLASLSYDGLVVLNHVPSTEKYKILL